MESFRKMIQSTLGRVFLVLVLVIFVLFAFGTSFMTPAGVQGEEAVVNDHKIMAGEVDKAVERQIARYSSQIDRKTLEKLIKREDVLEALIQERVMLDTARENGVVVSPELVQQSIMEIKDFQDESGKFSQSLFQQLVLRNGFANVAAFRQWVEDRMVAQQVTGALSDSAFATRPELELLTRMGEQQRDLAWVVFSPAAFTAAVTVSPAEIQARYDASPADYLSEELFSVEYLEANLSEYAAAQTVSEDEIRAKYDEMVARARDNAERRAAHILIAINASRDEKAARARADEVIAKLAAGESFARLAAQYSDDAGSKDKGGDLGYVSRGVLEASLDTALFALRPNDVSAPAKGTDGLHLLKVLEERNVDVPVFAQVRPGIVSGLSRDKARARFDSIVDELGAMAYESGDLQEPARKLGLQVRRTGLFGRQGGPGIVANPKVLKEVLSDDVLLDGRNSPVITSEEGQAIVLRVVEHRKPQRRPLAEVSESVRNTLMLEKAALIAAEKARALRDQVNSGTPLAQAAQQSGAVLQQAAAVRRASQQVPGELLKAAFALKRPADGLVNATEVDMAGGGKAVLVVSNVVDGTLLGVDAAKIASDRGQLAAEFGNRDFRQWLDQAEQGADVTRVRANEESLNVMEELGKLKQSAQRP